MYGSSASSSNIMPSSMSMPTISNEARNYSLSPSISGTSMSGPGSPPSMSSDMMPMGALSLTSSILPSSMDAFADPSALSQPYSMVHSSGLRHNAQSSPSSGFRNSRPSMGSALHSLNTSLPVAPQALPNQRRVSAPTSYDSFSENGIHS